MQSVQGLLVSIVAYSCKIFSAVLCIQVYVCLYICGGHGVVIVVPGFVQDFDLQIQRIFKHYSRIKTKFSRISKLTFTAHA